MEKLLRRGVVAEGLGERVRNETQKIRNIRGGTGGTTRVRGVLGTNPGLKSRLYTQCKDSWIVTPFQ